MVRMVCHRPPLMRRKAHGAPSATRFGPLAQLVEQETLNLLVVGSIPTRPTNSTSYARNSDRLALQAESKRRVIILPDSALPDEQHLLGIAPAVSAVRLEAR